MAARHRQASLASHLLVLVWLTSLASRASCFIPLGGLDALDGWLERRVQSEDPETNYRFALERRNQLGAFVGWLLRPAIGTLEVLGSARGECDDEVLSALETISEQNMAPGAGSRRIERVLRHYIDQLAEPCARTLDERFGEWKMQLDFDEVGPALRLLAPNITELFAGNQLKYANFLSKQYKLSYKYFADLSLVRVVAELASGGDDDERNNFVETSYDKLSRRNVRLSHPANLQAATKKYLFKPCNYFVVFMSFIYDAFQRLVGFVRRRPEDSRGRDLLSRRSTDFKAGLFIYNSCKYILGLHTHDFIRLMKEHSAANKVTL